MSDKSERRACADRRQLEMVPPCGWKDRRRRTERRIPELSECQVSEAEWLAYFGGIVRPTLAAGVVARTDVAAEVFARIGK